MIVRCEMCSGYKVIVGMGSIKHECPKCKGVGSVMVEPEVVEPVEITDAISHKGEIVKVKKKPGRKKREAA
jgi:hypothetical protein